jgi:hypothetical protein
VAAQAVSEGRHAEPLSRADALQAPLGGLAGYWLHVRCGGCQNTVYYPCKLMAQERGAAGLRVSAILPRLRCRTCRHAPAQVLLTDDPTGGTPEGAQGRGRSSFCRESPHDRGVIGEMIELEPLISQFVTDVLGCLRAARLEDLLVALNQVESERAMAAPVVRAVTPAEWPRRQSGWPTKASGSRRRGLSRTTPGPVVVAEPPKRAPAPPSGEITHPEALLSMGRPTPDSATRPVEQVDAEPETEAPPPSGVHGEVVRLPVRLREGETLARDTGAGVVIRRARTA